MNPRLSADRVVVVGESSPRGGDPADALLPAPSNSSGHRLMQIMGLSEARYLSLCRVNLCAGRWSTAEARDAAARLWLAVVGISFADPRPSPQATIILLGRKVAQAFTCVAYPSVGDGDGGESIELCRWESAVDSDLVATLVCLPHPSGLARAWNHSIRRPGGPAALARAILRRAAPHVPWSAPWRRHVQSSDEPGAWLDDPVHRTFLGLPPRMTSAEIDERERLAWEDESGVAIPAFDTPRVVTSALVVRSRKHCNGGR